MILVNRAPLRHFAAIILLSGILLGCTQPKKVHADYDQRASKIRTIGILTPDLTYYDLTFGGVQEKNDKWSEQASQNVADAIKGELSVRGFKVKIIARDGELKQSMDEIAGLFTLIAWSYHRHVLDENQANFFPQKAQSLDYSVGPIDDILDAYQVDALVLAGGGGKGNSKILPGTTVILVALVDRNGALLWYEPSGRREHGSKTDIRDAAHVRMIVRDMFEKMPVTHK